MAEEFVAMIETNRVGALQPGHPRDEIWLRSFENQMVMIAHQAVGMNLPSGFYTGFRQGLDEVGKLRVGRLRLIAVPIQNSESGMQNPGAAGRAALSIMQTLS